MVSRKILVVDDDKDICEAISIYLKSEGYESKRASNGKEALEMLANDSFDLVLLDIMMPVMDGIVCASKIRETSNIPIIFLSAKSEDSDKVLGLNIGADDYITKPFSPMELIARVKSLLRRVAMNVPDTGEIYRVGGLELNIPAKCVYVDGTEVKLTATEYKILELLMSNMNQVFSIDQIYEHVWNEPNINGENTVAVHIRKIREKIEINPKEPKYLKVVWGIGYKIENK